MSLRNIISEHNLEFANGGTDKNSTHSYVEHFYDDAFEKYKNRKVSLLEIGISQGFSFRLWKEYFQNAKAIVGIDNRPEAVHPRNKEIPGVTYHFGDAYTQEMVKNLPKFDIIIDDGCHQTDYQVKAIELYLPLLKKGGIYVIEDIQHEYPKYTRFEDPYKMLSDVVPEGYNYSFYDLRHIRNRQDDSLMVIQHAE